MWAEKIKVVRFVWKLAHRLSRGCWILFQPHFSGFPTLIPFLGKFEPKKSNLYILPGNWHTEFLEDVDSFSDISFLKFQTQISRILIFLPTFVYWNFKVKSIFVQIWVEYFKLPTLPGSWHTEYLEDVIARIQRKFWKQR